MKSRFLFADAEFGGIGLQYSLLTAHFFVVEYDGTNYSDIIDRLDLKMRPNDGAYVVTTEALELTKINLVEHNRIAIPYKMAGTLLYNFLLKSATTDTHLIPVGHGIGGDIDQITDKLISVDSWRKFTSYNPIDTLSLAQWIRSLGIISPPNGIGLSSLRDYFKIEIIGDAHDAKYDAELNFEIFKRLQTV